MGYLLDTHAFIWFIEGDSSLPISARSLIESDLPKFVSIASLWEIAIKISLGKLALNGPFSAIADQIAANGFHVLDITFEDTVRVSELPFIHRDPFDRILIAQSKSNGLTIITRDTQFSAYTASTVW